MSSPYRLLGFTLLPIIRWRIRNITGLEHLPTSGGFIIAANHQSWADSAIIAGALYRHIRMSLRVVAQSSKYRFLGGVPIDEYDKSRVIDIVAGYLKAGHPILIFPEGNSNKNPELRTGKTGAARLALRSGLPVIPVGIQGTEGVKAWQAALWFLQFWKPCRVIIGQSLTFPKTSPAEIDHDQLMTVTFRIMQRISHYSGKAYPPNPDTPFQEKTAGIVKRSLRKAAGTWLNPRLRLIGVEHLPAHGPFIIAANHQSYFDPIALAAAVWRERKIQPYFLTKGSIANKWQRVVGAGTIEAFGMLPVDQKDKSKILTGAENHLRAGGVIGIFPEGTRNKPSLNPDWRTTMLKGKTGVARLYLSTKAPVIPAGIKAPPGISHTQMAMSVVRWWEPVTITFGPPVELPSAPVGEPTKKDLDDITRAVMQRISQLTGMKYPY